MQVKGNTILITGGGSGIGRGLAEAFHKLGNKVIIAGRRANVLEEVTRTNPGMESATFDVQDPASIEQFATDIVARFPTLNTVILNAGIMQRETIGEGGTKIAEDTISTNLLGPIRLTSALLPSLRRQPHGAIVTVTSGLAFMPLAMNPTYCATKAAIHSWGQSLRFQLRDTKIQVLEIAPPYVQTELTGAHQKTDPMAVPLDDYISEVMGILEHQPEANEVLVKSVLSRRYAEERGAAGYVEFFNQFNEQMLKQRG